MESLYEILALILGSGVVLLVANKLIDMGEKAAQRSNNSFIKILGSMGGIAKKAVVVLVEKAKVWVQSKLAKKEKKKK